MCVLALTARVCQSACSTWCLSVTSKLFISWVPVQPASRNATSNRWPESKCISGRLELLKHGLLINLLWQIYIDYLRSQICKGNDKRNKTCELLISKQSWQRGRILQQINQLVCNRSSLHIKGPLTHDKHRYWLLMLLHAYKHCLFIDVRYYNTSVERNMVISISAATPLFLKQVFHEETLLT